MATITISAPVSRRTVLERRPVASARRTPVSRKAVRRMASAPSATVISHVVIPEAATLYAAGGSPVHPEPVAVSAPARPAASRQGALRLTPRGRRLARTAVVLLALVAALAFSLASHSASSSAGDGPAVAATTTVVVQPGQTLWSIARGLSADVDVRETVARIQELNGLSGTRTSTVLPGQALVVPVVG